MMKVATTIAIVLAVAALGFGVSMITNDRSENATPPDTNVTADQGGNDEILRFETANRQTRKQIA